MPFNPDKPWSGLESRFFQHQTKATLPTVITEPYLAHQNNHMIQYDRFWHRSEDYPSGFRGIAKQSYQRRALIEEVSLVNTYRKQRSVMIAQGDAYQEVRPEPEFGGANYSLYYAGDFPLPLFLPINDEFDGFRKEIAIRQTNIEFDIDITFEDYAYTDANLDPLELTYNFTGEIEQNPVSVNGASFLEPREKCVNQTTLRTHKNYSHKKWWNYGGPPYEGIQYHEVDNVYGDAKNFEVVKMYEERTGNIFTGMEFHNFIGWYFQIPPVKIGRFDLQDTVPNQSNYFLGWSSAKASVMDSYYAVASEVARKEFDITVNWEGSSYPWTFTCDHNLFHLFTLNSFSGSGSMDFEFFDLSAIQ